MGLQDQDTGSIRDRSKQRIKFNIRTKSGREDKSFKRWIDQEYCEMKEAESEGSLKEEKDRSR